MREIVIAKHKHSLSRALTHFNAGGQPIQNGFYFLNFFQFLRNMCHIQHGCTRK